MVYDSQNVLNFQKSVYKLAKSPVKLFNSFPFKKLLFIVQIKYQVNKKNLSITRNT